MEGVTYDTGALNAADRNARRMCELTRRRDGCRRAQLLGTSRFRNPKKPTANRAQAITVMTISETVGTEPIGGLPIWVVGERSRIQCESSRPAPRNARKREGR